MLINTPPLKSAKVFEILQETRTEFLDKALLISLKKEFLVEKNTDNSIWDLKLSVDIKFCALMLSFNQKQNEMLNLFLLCQIFILCLLTVARSYSRNKMATYGN